jgi:hypothetical protein
MKKGSRTYGPNESKHSFGLILLTSATHFHPVFIILHPMCVAVCRSRSVSQSLSLSCRCSNVEVEVKG